MPDTPLPVTPAGRSHAAEIAAVMREAYAEAARSIGLSRETFPAHHAFCHESWIQDDLQRGVEYYQHMTDSGVAGCYGLTGTRPGACRITRLAVRPNRQGSGVGSMLLDDARCRASAQGCDLIEVTVLEHNANLVAWYRRRGFELSGTARYGNLPFSVGFLFAELGQKS